MGKLCYSSVIGKSRFSIFIRRRVVDFPARPGTQLEDPRDALVCHILVTSNLWVWIDLRIVEEYTVSISFCRVSITSRYWDGTRLRRRDVDFPARHAARRF